MPGVGVRGDVDHFGPNKNCASACLDSYDKLLKIRGNIAPERKPGFGDVVASDRHETARRKIVFDSSDPLHGFVRISRQSAALHLSHWLLVDLLQRFPAIRVAELWPF